MSELVYNRRYQAWADRQAREAEGEEAATGDAEGAAPKQARGRQSAASHKPNKYRKLSSRWML